MTDNAKAIGKDCELISILEMPVDVHLFSTKAGGGMGRLKPVSHRVRINIRLVFVKGFELSDKVGVVFVDVKLNTEGVKGENLC